MVGVMEAQAMGIDRVVMSVKEKEVWSVLGHISAALG